MKGRVSTLRRGALSAVCLLLAGCGAFNPSVVQGSSSETALEQGIGQQFQKLVPQNTVVHDVHCRDRRRHSSLSECEITMIRNDPAPKYDYVVFARGTRFTAQLTSSAGKTSWTPPETFGGGY